MTGSWKIAGLVAIIAAAALIILPGGDKTQNLQTDNNPTQTPLQINDSSSTQTQAGGVDLQSSMPSGSGLSPVTGSQASTQSGSSSSTPAQPSDSTPQPNYPPCYSCTPGGGRLCPDYATRACYCNGTLERGDNIACLEQ